MLELTNIILMNLLSLIFLLILIFSFLEKEKRPALIAAVLLIANLAFWAFLNHSHEHPIVRAINLVIIFIILIIILLAPWRFFPDQKTITTSTIKTESIEQFDERNHMFSRNALKFSPELKELYYRSHPEYQKVDELIHRKSELGQPGGVYYEPLRSTAFKANFSLLAKLNRLAESKPEEIEKEAEKKHLFSEANRRKIREVIEILAVHHGAADIGFTSLKKYLLYSHHGRHPENWGQPIENNHQTCIVILVPMKIAAIRKSPGLEVIEESARTYVEAAKIAFIITEFLKLLGAEARAHTDANYEVLLVPAAIEAGLGQLGRVGLLIHPRLGPCVRMSAVTTNLDLLTDVKQRATGEKWEHISFFCQLCHKCADNCPTGSISRENAVPLARGFPHWSIRQESCYSFWKTLGTDCGICLKVCPFSKEDNPLHRLVRWYVSRNILNQKIALLFDDWLYGRKVKVKFTGIEGNQTGLSNL